MSFHYLEWGQPGNPLIVMLHGGSQQAHSWDFVSLPLSEDYHIIALDQRGHGDSDWAADGDYTVEAHQGDIDGFVAALGLSNFHLIGHSMAGATATSGLPATRSCSSLWSSWIPAGGTVPGPQPHPELP